MFQAEILETYPARIADVYGIKVIKETETWDLIPMVMVNGTRIAAARGRNLQNEDTNPNTGNSYNFTQNNYSPKALSRTEIYRQTKNQFSAMERMVET